MAYTAFGNRKYQKEVRDETDDEGSPIQVTYIMKRTLAGNVVEEWTADQFNDNSLDGNTETHKSVIKSGLGV